jgi:hypothetical protein
MKSILFTFNPHRPTSQNRPKPIVCSQTNHFIWYQNASIYRKTIVILTKEESLLSKIHDVISPLSNDKK